MEEQYYADRVHLKQLLHLHPTWQNAQYAEATRRSLGWVKKWKKRLRAAPADDETVLRGRSRRPHRRAPRIHPEVVQQILSLRDSLPSQLGRVAGPRAIIYYLQQEAGVVAKGHHLPTSSSTIYHILSQHGRIHRPKERRPQPWPEQEPLQSWQLDFKDISTVEMSETQRKQQHLVESLNVVDEGTSLVMGAKVRADFNSETALLEVAAILAKQGVPRQITFDRDPRFVGAWTGQDFPTPFVRFWLTLGVQVVICPPQRPDRNAFVERYHRNYNQECLLQQRPVDCTSAQAVTDTYVRFYNHERPNQARSCANQPPAWALAQRGTIPVLPALPQEVDPDRWLEAIHGRVYTRRISAKGTFQLDGHSYYVQTALAKQTVMVEIDARRKELLIYQPGRVLKRVPLRGLHNQRMSWATYLQTITQEARTQWALYTHQQRRRRSPQT